jgi:hypothetical protein
MKDEYALRCASALERISLILGALYADKYENLDLGTRAKKLNQIGFTNTEAAKLLGTSANSINVLLHLTRKRKAKTQSKKRKKAKQRI